MLPPLPRRLEISYQNVANLASEPPVNFINFMKSNNSLLMPVFLAIPVFVDFKSPKSDRNQGLYSLLNAFERD